MKKYGVALVITWVITKTIITLLKFSKDGGVSIKFRDFERQLELECIKFHYFLFFNM